MCKNYKIFVTFKKKLGNFHNIWYNNSNYNSYGFKLNSKANLSDGKADVVLVKREDKKNPEDVYGLYDVELETGSKLDFKSGNACLQYLSNSQNIF